MPNTIKNRLQRALLQIAENPTATAQERLDALSLLLEVRESAKERDDTTPGKRTKLANSSIGILGTR